MQTGNYAVKINQRQIVEHGEPETPVVGVFRIVAPVTIAKKSIRSKMIAVGPFG